MPGDQMLKALLEMLLFSLGFNCSLGQTPSSCLKTSLSVCPLPPVALPLTQSKGMRTWQGPGPPDVPTMLLPASPTTPLLACSAPVMLLLTVPQAHETPRTACSAPTWLPQASTHSPLLLRVCAQLPTRHWGFSGYCISNNSPEPAPNTPFPRFLNYFPQQKLLPHPD